MKRPRTLTQLLIDDGKNVSLPSSDPSLESLTNQCRTLPGPLREKETSSQTGQKIARRPRPHYSAPLPTDEVLHACTVQLAPVEPAISLRDRLQRVQRLNRVLSTVVPRIQDAEREEWVALVEELSLRRAGKDVSLKACIAPGTLDSAESVYMDHRETLYDDARDRKAGCANVAHEDIGEEMDFLSYVQTVLDDAGKKQFLTALFYGGGAPLDTREMLRVYRDG